MDVAVGMQASFLRGKVVALVIRAYNLGLIKNESWHFNFCDCQDFLRLKL